MPEFKAGKSRGWYEAEQNRMDGEVATGVQFDGENGCLDVRELVT